MKFIYFFIICIFFSNNLIAQDYTIERWRVVEIELTSSGSYTDPFNDIDVTASFNGPGGATIVRPAFWNGGSVWVVRFAPTNTGTWTMTTTCNITSDTGLNNITKTIQCNDYTGDHEIYKRGFLKVSPNGRYFTYNDGTPFFYLGDTHWVFIHERFDTSNVAGVASQFKYTVDKRVNQSFTVYQTEAIQHPHGGDHSSSDEEAHCNFRDGFSSADLPGFENIDRKFKYIADQGLVNANSSICWVSDPKDFPSAYTEQYMARLSKYWVARYGAYPVLWTIAQEVDDDFYGNFDSVVMAKWYAVAQAIEDNDTYQHPLSAHMEDVQSSGNYASTSPWGNKTYHDWWAIQWQGDQTEVAIAKNFWSHIPAKPSVLYEAPYDSLWTDTKGARGAAYKAFQYGIYGYGYGANGIWNDLYAIGDYGTSYLMPDEYLNWYEGANLPAGTQMTYFKNFYDSLEWWKLMPRFDDQFWADFTDTSHSLLSTDGQETYVIYFGGLGTSTGTLKNLVNEYSYSVKWYNPRTGEYTNLPRFVPAFGNHSLNVRPTEDDWVLLVQKDGPASQINLALNRSYSSSSNWDATQTSEKAFDSNPVTNWQAAYGSSFDGQWLAVDFDETIQFDSVRISEYGDRTSGFRIEYSNDNVNWETAYTGSVIGSNRTVTFPEATGRYARIYFTSGTFTPIIYEFEIYIRKPVISGQLENIGFEEPEVLTYQYGPFFNSWLFNSQAGVQKNGSAWGASDAPEGLQTCFLQGEGACITQTINFSGTNDYYISFKAARRFTNTQCVEVYIDTVNVGSFTPSSSDFETFNTDSFEVEEGIHTIKFLGVTSGDQTVFLDQISLVRIIPESINLALNKTYNSSSNWNSTQTADKAFDNNIITNWQSEYNSGYDGEWLEVNFGETTPFDSIWISEYGDRVTGYRIEYSIDGTNWNTAYTGTTIGSSKFIKLSNVVNGNYARIYFLSGTGTAGINQPIIYEFEIYNTSNLKNISLSNSIKHDKPNESTFKLYPNPIKGKVTLSYIPIEKEQTILKVYNTEGRLVKSEDLPQGKSAKNYNLDLSGLEQGIYIIKCSNSRYNNTQKVVVIK